MLFRFNGGRPCQMARLGGDRVADTFNTLRAHDEERRKWISVARRFERAIARLHDDELRGQIEARFQEAAAKPLAPAELGEDLVAEAIEAREFEMPLTGAAFEFALEDGASPDELILEGKAWKAAEERRRAAYFEEEIETDTL